MKIHMTAPCLFGLESILGFEVKRLGAEEVEVADGRVSFLGDEHILARANLELRTAERVCVVLGSFEAQSFEELFNGVEELPLEDFIGKTDAFPVKGWSLKSQLHSIPDCQRIIKKAAAKRMGRIYGKEILDETGPLHQIRFSILKDKVTIMLDTSGEGLHKRGYRRNSGEAPIKETLAAGIADLARVRENDRVIDPMCGSGTLLIESALRVCNIAPGLLRTFAAEQWGMIDSSVWRQERERALEKVNKKVIFRGIGLDTDAEAIRLTTENAKKAQVDQLVSSAQQDILDFTGDGEKTTILCNPPYGERLLEIREAEKLYSAMGEKFARQKGISCYIISPHEDFETFFGRKADRRRKLYNGMIKCQLYMYFTAKK